MLVRRVGEIEVHIGDRELHESNGESSTDFVESFYRVFLRRKLVRKLVETNQRLTGLDRIVMLGAHAGLKPWEFRDDYQGGSFKVQDWIDEVDEKYGLIILACCNPRNARIQSKKSVVLHTTENISLLDVYHRRLKTKVYFPGFGYIEDSYRTIKKIIAEQS